MLVIDNYALTRIAKKPEVIAEFPFLKQARTAGCNCSGKKGPDLNAIKGQLASLAEPGQKRLKALLKVDQLKIIYRNESGVITVVF